MVTLHAQLGRKWDSPPFVARVTTIPNRPLPLREREVLLVDGTLADPPSGFQAYLHKPDRMSMPSDAATAGRLDVLLPEPLRYLGDGDVIRLAPATGEIFVLYRRCSPSNVLLLTERCNCSCIMCPQPPRQVDDRQYLADCLAAIRLMSPQTGSLGITGGEPTLAADGLLQVVQACRGYLPNTALHLLSNGRMFYYLTLCQALATLQHPDLMVGIPLYSDIANRHDFVVQACGAFDQTVRGIMNLRRCGIRVEIRVVLHRFTVDRLPQLARFIGRNLPFVEHVALMGLELMGYAKANAKALWVNPNDYQSALQAAVQELVRAGVKASIYNHQLCTLPTDLWPLAYKSISDWKNVYPEPCDPCAVRGQCGGFFESSVSWGLSAVRPIADAPAMTAEASGA